MDINNRTTSVPSTVVGYFSNRSSAEKAVNELKDAGFASSQIGVIAHSAARTNVSGTQPANAPGTVRGTAETAGEKARSTWDKIVDFFQGKSTHDHTTEYDNEYDYEAGEFDTSLDELQIPRERGHYFHHHFGRNSEATIVSVNATGRESEAETILKRHGADFGENAANYTYSDRETARENYPQRIQLLGEALRVHKQRISRGDVRLRKQVVNDTQTVQVPVEREELVIERTAGNQAPVEAEVGSSGELRVPLSEEKVTLEKQPYVREEVSVGKRTVSDVQQFEERVRREELEVDDKRKNRSA